MHYMYVIKISLKGAMNLKKSGEEYKERFGRRKGQGEMCIIVSKIKKKGRKEGNCI